ncbi:MAG: alpha-E domain-containing protein [Imperialibacter sp.]|uniref:alpha-E domain-containing protein n=1 Tax=Imperialibacter sp. TaxID=2038411 RepID=UPI0032EB0839
MLSRVADSLFWMARYMERSDGILRMLKVNYNSSQDNLSDFSWQPVLKVFTYLEGPAIIELANESSEVLRYMILDKENGNSVQNIVIHARENARSVQDNVTIEVWQCLNDFYHLIRDERHISSLAEGDAISVIDLMVKQCLVYYGTVDITMSRGSGYCFMSLGKFLERALQSIDILDVKLGSMSAEDTQAYDTLYWKYLLMSVSGYKLYLKNYQSGFEARNVVHQIVLNTHFPRSVIYSLDHLHRNFEQLSAYLDKASFDELNFEIGKLRSKVRYSTLEDIEAMGLHTYLVDIKKDLSDISSKLNQYCFAYS